MPRITETFWPVLRDTLLRDPQGMGRLDLNCAVCNRRMVLNDENYHDPVILPCGHMIGKDCLIRRVVNGPIVNAPFDCPLCHISLRHPLCGHSHDGFQLPSCVDCFEDVPPTVPEGGGQLAPSCPECYIVSFLKGLESLWDSLNMNQLGLPANQFIGFTADDGYDTYCTVDSTNVKVGRIDIPQEMARIVAEATEQFNERSEDVWLTGYVGEIKVKCYLYQEPNARGGRAGRFVNRLRRRLTNRR
ncbi:hypothetical protein FALBO_16144 [Fusarium albosuccineum]|uniref:RING-type domain-containing protein n=1 Tax=Fusarium albosuccineum TaxID=1237068 RepID=A0A8H4KNY6_9HYPO|nr:hypothetical protein FALBO_16144 [Fusarium albosuccineum]